MRRIHLAATVFGLFAIGAILTAADAPPADFKKAMQEIGAGVQALSKPGATEDMELAKTSAITIKAAFTVVENYWNSKDAEAAKLAHAGFKAAADIQVSTQFNSVEGVTQGLQDLTATCTACHTAHREKGTDGFLIK